jgi:hypothetical protein
MLEARVNYHESQVTRRNIRRTISMVFAAPIGPLVLTSTADVGEQANRRSVSRIAFVNAELRWTRDRNSLSFTASHSTATGRPTERADLLGTVNARGLEFAGGAWITRGYSIGGAPGFWATVGIPASRDRIMNFGIDYSPPTWTSKPSLRGVFTVHQRIAIPIPFIPSPDEGIACE